MIIIKSLIMRSMFIVSLCFITITVKIHLTILIISKNFQFIQYKVTKYRLIGFIIL
jgi:hypothetical protein